MSSKTPVVLVLEDSKIDFMLISMALKDAGFRTVDANLVWSLPDKTVAFVADWTLPCNMLDSRKAIFKDAEAAGVSCCIYTGSLNEKEIRKQWKLQCVPDGTDIIQKQTGGNCSELVEWLCTKTGVLDGLGTAQESQRIQQGDRSPVGDSLG